MRCLCIKGPHSQLSLFFLPSFLSTFPLTFRFSNTLLRSTILFQPSTLVACLLAAACPSTQRFCTKIIEKFFEFFNIPIIYCTMPRSAASSGSDDTPFEDGTTGAKRKRGSGSGPAAEDQQLVVRLPVSTFNSSLPTVADIAIGAHLTRVG